MRGVLGVLGVLSYPLLARRVFIDENASLHGHGAIGFGADEALRAHEYALKAEGVIDALGADADGHQIYDALTAFAAAELDTGRPAARPPDRPPPSWMQAQPGRGGPSRVAGDLSGFIVGIIFS